MSWHFSILQNLTLNKEQDKIEQHVLVHVFQTKNITQGSCFEITRIKMCNFKVIIRTEVVKKIQRL